MNTALPAPLPRAEPIVYVVDDDPLMRDALLDLFMATEFKAKAFPDVSGFLAEADIDAPGCVVVDLRMPGGSGLDLQRELTAAGSSLPLIFLTAHADVPSTVRAMKAGAIDFLTKPFSNQDLVDAVDGAIRLNAERLNAVAVIDEINGMIETLTRREVEVMYAVASGLMNKQVAFQLGITEMTVKLHRMSLMKKMQCRTLAELVRKVEQSERARG